MLFMLYSHPESHVSSVILDLLLFASSFLYLLFLFRSFVCYLMLVPFHHACILKVLLSFQYSTLIHSTHKAFVTSLSIFLLLFSFYSFALLFAAFYFTIFSFSFSFRLKHSETAQFFFYLIHLIQISHQ